MIGVSILVKGSTIGTLTDLDGNFALEVANENATLEFSYLGFRYQTVEVSSSNNTLNIVLKQNLWAWNGPEHVTGHLEKVADQDGFTIPSRRSPRRRHSQ